MNSRLHDIRNNLAVAIGSIHAFIDAKLAPDARNLAGVLQALEEIDAALPALRAAAASAEVAGNEMILEAIIEGSPFAKVLVDDRGRIMLVNAQTESLFRYSREELLGQSIELLVPLRFRGAHPSLRDDFNVAPSARPMGAGRDLHGRRRDGSEFPIEIGLNPIRMPAATFTLAAISDITERKRAEELRLAHAGVTQHAEQLETLNRELATASRFQTQFIATMTHELRTPLTAIVGATELLNRSALDERARLAVETINEASDTLLSLINSVLDFSKVQAGKLALRTAAFSVESVVEGTAEVVAALAREKGVTLYTYVDQSIPTLEGDADRLRQILLNLLGNAVKFTDRGHVVARVLTTTTAERRIALRFEVEDSGIGIAPDVVPQLFEPFTQAAADARHITGTGLGLSIARGIVELMDGKIGVDSVPGIGSTFWFTATFGIAAEPLEAHHKILDGFACLIVSGDDTWADIIQQYMGSWSMDSRRVRSRDDVIDAMQDASRTWIAVVDLENVGVVDGVTFNILRAILPARIIAVGNDSALRKPTRQSSLYDAIVHAAGTDHFVPAGRPPVAPLPAMPSGTVLVAEDNAQLVRLLKLQFDELGVRTVFVADGQQAVDAVRHQHYALVFMDCQMPVMDGLAATRAIRAEEHVRGGHLPIAAMTANAFAEDRDACLAAGMDDYLAKPVKLKDLHAMIERWSSYGATTR